MKSIQFTFVLHSDHQQILTKTYQWSSVGKSQLVDKEPAKSVPLGWYDCGDGFYNPANRIVYDYNIKFLRNAGRCKMPHHINELS